MGVMEVVIEVTVVYVGFNEGIIIEDGQRTSVVLLLTTLCTG